MSKQGSYQIERRHFVLAGAAALLSGCGSIQLIPQPMQPQLYVLRPQVAPPMGAPVRWRLTVGPPDAPASLDTARIALSRSATTMDYFANAAWNERLPLIFQRLLIQTFDASNRIVAVDRDTSGSESDYLLETEIRDFQAHYDTPDGAPQINITIQAKLTRMPQREIVSSLSVVQQAQASGNTLDNIVSAFDTAAGAAIGQITAWTLNAPPPASPG